MTKELPTVERGIRIAKVRLILHSGEVEEYAFDTTKLNILLGVRNSSKTTTLRVIDYCLGDRGTPVKALNAAVVDKYQALSVEVRINGRPYAITRNLTRGSLSKVYIDDAELTADAFSDWILAELGWPNLNIPLGLNPATAPSLTPLSFRNTLRHIYRDEGSWISFANKEQEFMRQAVVSQLLGYAPRRYGERRQEYDLACATRQLDEAQSADRQAGESSLQAVTAISHSLNLPLARSTSQIADARNEVATALAAVRRRRQDLTTQIAAIEAGNAEEGGAPVGYDTALTAAYQELAGRLKQATDDTTGLREVLAEHQRSARMVEAEIRRMERLSTSIEVFDALPVRMCPACEQDVDPQREHPVDACHLCFQPVDDDKRLRRAKVEIRSLESELEDLEEVIRRTTEDLGASEAAQRDLESQHAAHAQRLNAERAAQLAPFMAELENLAAAAARLEHKLTAFPAIGEILQKRDVTRQALHVAEQRVLEVKNRPRGDQASTLTASERCERFANRMNDFLAPYRSNLWVTSNVSIRDTDLTFYVGSRPWHDALGAASKVLFFLAYSYATLYLAQDLDQDCAFPGCLILDNPYQQGIDEHIVMRVLTTIAQAAEETGTQVISTQQLVQPKPPTIPAIRTIPMPNVYAAP
ncbi:hypothetical protein [Streptomyces sp. NBC_01643]|uniref:hypothetical protein n=1 Tax=Streptomyces sp. NBC_01643 TaxID=2975906 RepID=UPI00386FAF86|nr:hypothetical protein OHB03_04030 [Streptomyces sp. NBC_01643]